MSCQTTLRRSVVSLRPLGRRSAAVAAASLAAAVLAAVPAVSRGQSLTVDTLAGNPAYTPTADSPYTAMTVGDASVGTVVQTQFNVSSTGPVILGNQSGGTGTWLLSGTGALIANTSGGSLMIGNAGTGIFNASNTSQVRLGVNALYLGNASGGSGTLNIADTATVTTATQYIGFSGTGVVNQTGGTFGSFNGSTYYSSVMGFNAGSTGTYNLMGGTYAAFNVFVGYGGTGTFNQMAGSTVNSIGGLVLGNVAGGRGVATVTGGTATYSGSATGIQVGASGVGIYNQTGGATNAGGGSLLIASNAIGSGTAFVSGGTFQCSGAYVGYGGTGALQLSGGTINAATQFASAVGYLAGSTGTMNMSGGTFNALATYIGYSGNGVLNQVGGTFNTGSSSVSLARLAVNSAGVYNMTGGTATLASLFDGYNGSGGVTVSGGTMNLTGSLYEGYNATTSVGALTLSGTGTMNVSGGVYVNFSGAGSSLNISGGTMNVTGTFYGQDNAGLGTVNVTGGTLNTARFTSGTFSTTATGIVNLSGGAINSTNGAFIGATDIAVVNQTGGTMTVGMLPVNLGNSSTGAATYNLSGGTLATIGVAKGAGTGTFNFNGGTLLANASSATFMTGLTAANVLAGGALINTNGFRTTVAQPLLNGVTGTDGGLTKTGANTLVLTGASTYNGGTNISAGTVRANGPLQSLGTGTATIASVATLGGNGSTGGAVVVNGTVTGGADSATTGTLTSAAQTWNGGGNFLVKFAADGSTNDQLSMSGLTIASTPGTPFVVNLAGVGGSAAPSTVPNGTYVLATDTGNAPGVFNNSIAAMTLTLAVPPNSINVGFQLSLVEVDGTGFEQLVLVAAPEPTSLLLVGLVASPLALGRGRRRAATVPTVA